MTRRSDQERFSVSALIFTKTNLFLFSPFSLSTFLVRHKMNNILKVCDLVNGCSPCTYLFKILHHCFISFHHSNRMRKIHQGFFLSAVSG